MQLGKHGERTRKGEGEGDSRPESPQSRTLAHSKLATANWSGLVWSGLGFGGSWLAGLASPVPRTTTPWGVSARDGRVPGHPHYAFWIRLFAMDAKGRRGRREEYVGGR